MHRLNGLLILVFGALPAFAAGPDSVALSDRSLWPEPLSTPAAFDRASRAEMLVFSAAFADLADEAPAQLQTRYHLKRIDADSIARLRRRYSETLAANWRLASTACAHADEPFCPAVSSAESMATAGRALPGARESTYAAWLADARKFHRLYAGELLRLAALFPKTSSEIDTFSPLELTGFERPDRHFLLTFDDGPTARGGDTDRTLAALAGRGLHAEFFLLGEPLQARLGGSGAAALSKLYEGHCVALHGWRHESHARMQEWEISVADTRDLVRKTFPALYRPHFRPPYGQRTPESGSYFQKESLRVSLWNIDSQDWNANVGGTAAGDRVLTLMLLWRRGTILFHDVHPKAATAVPRLLDATRDAGLIWDGCGEP